MTGRRQKPRFRMVLPVSIWGTDKAGKAFNQLAYTLDISTGGARLAGVPAALNCGDIVAVRYKQRKARFRVVWVNQTQAGVQYLENEAFIWVELPEGEFTDLMPEVPTPARGAARLASAERKPAAMEAPPSDTRAQKEAPPPDTPAEPDVATDVPLVPAALQKRNDELAAALENCLASLRSLNDLVNAAGMPAQVAQEFHAAAAHLRNTAWAVQQWVELQQDPRDKSHILASVNSERVRFAAQLCCELVQEQLSLTAGVSQENRQALAAAVQSLAWELGLGVQPPSRQRRMAGPAERDPVALLAGLNQEIRASTLSAAETLQLMAERARSFTDADGAAIAWRDQDEMVCCASSGVAPLVGIRFSMSGSVVGEAIAGRRSVICRDAVKDESADASLCRSVDVRSSAITPIVARDSVMGVLQVFAGSPDAFDDATVSLLQHLAEFAALLEPGPPAASDSR
ncbi:MAG TPA: GAF domain-containing protein [Terriglobales bacterium]|nr:GAF domain-containing protein [Terriglobales bacterium]